MSIFKITNNAMFTSRWRGLAMAFVALSFAAVASAQSMLEEVVVTAQKREQGLQDVGIAVSAFTGEQLRAFDATDSFDIAAYTPGVHISGNLAGQNTQFTIRGVTQNDFNDIIESPNAVYLDEGYIAIAQAQTFALLDLERVEILKGPQGTLFGRNATGGVVSFFSKKPSFDGFEGFIQADYGTFDVSNDAQRWTLEGAVGGPISDKVAFRAAFRQVDQEPYLENRYRTGVTGTDRDGMTSQPELDVFGGPPLADPDTKAGADLGDDDTWVFRGSLAFQPSDRLRIDLSVNMSESEVSTGPYQSKPTIAVVRDVATPGLVDTDGNPITRSEVINVIDMPAGERRLSILVDENGMDTGMDGGADAFTDEAFSMRDAGRVAPPAANNGDPVFVTDGMGGTVGMALFSIRAGGQGRIGLDGRRAAGGDFFGYRDPDGDDFTFSGDYAIEDQGFTENNGYNARVEYDLSDTMNFVSVTDYKTYEKGLFIDVDAAPVNQLVNYAGVDASSATQEFRLTGSTDRSDWVAGFYYLNIDTDSSNALKAPPGSVFSTVVEPYRDTGADIVTIATLETDSYSLFGQYEHQVTDEVRLIGGLRFIKEEKDFDLGVGVTLSEGISHIQYDKSKFIPGGAQAGDPYFHKTDSSNTHWAGKLQVDYTPNDDLLVYAGVNRGVKAGSYNAPLLGAYLGAGGNAGLPYDEEVLTSYEAGFKATVLGGRARLNGSIYYYDYADYQAFLFVGVGGVSINQDAETTGAEIELQASPTEDLDLILSASYMDATIDGLPLRNGSPLPSRDVTPTYAPELQTFAMLRYGFNVLGGRMTLQGDVSYSDEFYYNLRNFDADKFDSYTMYNGMLSWTSPDEAWTASLLFNNITDERAGIQGFDLATLCGCNEVSYRAPRNYSLQVKREF